MINPLKEKVMPLSRLGRHLPESPKYTTLMDWCKRGRVNWSTRRRVKLECITLPSGISSSLEAYLRFITKLNERG
jgi:hypothetical protein